jgi:crotonyl-CoA reductase
MLDPEQRIWGFETNFGGLAGLAVVKTNQLMPKPSHLTWEEAACPGLVNSTAYRQLVSRNGAGMKLGDELVIDRSAATGEGYAFWADDTTQDPSEWRRFGAKIRELTGGKVGVLTVAPTEGLGVSDPEKRQRYATELAWFRNV